jgi:hypothetical protein
MSLSGSRVYELTASRSLTPGSNELKASVRIGERIIWQQEFTLTAQ